MRLVFEIAIQNWEKHNPNPKKQKASFRWCRLDAGFCRDPKFAGYTAEQRHIWAVLLCLACDGKGGKFEVEVKVGATLACVSKKRFADTCRAFSSQSLINLTEKEIKSQKKFPVCDDFTSKTPSDGGTEDAENQEVAKNSRAEVDHEKCSDETRRDETRRNDNNSRACGYVENSVSCEDADCISAPADASHQTAQIATLTRENTSGGTDTRHVIKIDQRAKSGDAIAFLTESTSAQGKGFAKPKQREVRDEAIRMKDHIASVLASASATRSIDIDRHLSDTERAFVNARWGDCKTLHRAYLTYCESGRAGIFDAQMRDSIAAYLNEKASPESPKIGVRVAPLMRTETHFNEEKIDAKVR